MKAVLIAMLTAAIIFCSACAAEPVATDSAAEAPSNGPRNMADPPQDEFSAVPKKIETKDVTLADTSESRNQAVEVKERKIIRNATLRLESGKPLETQKRIIEIAKANGGFVLESNTSQADDRVRNQNSFAVTLQVPSTKFDAALAEIRKVDVRILSESIKGQDVTEEFIDVEARLKTKKALEERFLEIMKRANTVKDALDVERELESVRSEIERIEGRKRSLENLTSLSKVTVQVIPPSAISASSTGFWYQLRDAVSDGFEGALTFVLILVRVLIALIPFLLIVVLPILFALRYLWKRYSQNRRARAAAAEVEKLTEDVE